jgi:phosphate transport system substrate-binding protein
MNRRFFLRLVLVAALCGPSFSCAQGGTTIQGSGATFPAPLYKRWFLEYYKAHHNVRVNYQAIGSGAGIRQFTEGLTAFGASDAAMNDKEIALFLKQRGSEVVLLPMTAGSVVICYNVEGVNKPIRLSRRTYLRIFLNKIRSWNDPEIQEDNKGRGINLPSTPITVVRRADGSGTTYAFTNHLKAVGEAIGIKWTPGVSKSSDGFPGQTIGGRGNPGVAALIQQVPGAIGYLEFGYAELADLEIAVLQNKSGKWIPDRDREWIPNRNKERPKFLDALKAASVAALKPAEDFQMPARFRIWLPDPPGEDAYPIVTYTWLLCYKDYTKYPRYRDNPKVATTLREVIRWCLTDGQKISEQLGYIRLPPEVTGPVLKGVEEIRP